MVAAQVERVPGAARFPVVDVPNEDAGAALGVDLVADGTLQGLVKGHIHTAAFLHTVVAKLRTNRRVTHCFVLELPTYPKLLTVTDAAEDQLLKLLGVLDRLIFGFAVAFGDRFSVARTDGIAGDGLVDDEAGSAGAEHEQKEEHHNQEE